MPTYTLHLGTFTCRKATTWDRRFRPGVKGVPKASTVPLDHGSRLQWGMLQRTMLQQTNAKTNSFYQWNQDATRNTDASYNESSQTWIHSSTCRTNALEMKNLPQYSPPQDQQERWLLLPPLCDFFLWFLWGQVCSLFSLRKDCLGLCFSNLQARCTEVKKK